jgi:hypothetical protein
MVRNVNGKADTPFSRTVHDIVGRLPSGFRQRRRMPADPRCFMMARRNPAVLETRDLGRLVVREIVGGDGRFLHARSRFLHVGDGDRHRAVEQPAI